MTNTAHYRLIDGEKSISLDNLQRWELLGNVPWHDGGQGGTLRYHAAVPTVYRATDIRANAISGLPWAIVRGETDVWDSETAAVPPDLAMLAELPTWLWRIEAALCLTSTAYFYKLRNRVRTLGLRWMDPTSIAPIIDLHNGITGWQRGILGRDIPMHLALEDVVSIWLWGLGEVAPRPAPAQAALMAAGASYNLQAFVASYFRRGAIKATLLTVEGSPAQPERERLKAWWDRVVGGMRNAFGAEVVSASVKPVVIGEGIKDLSNTELTNSQREEIAIAFGVPHSMLFADAANYATAQQDELNFYNTTVVPEAKLIASQLNEHLFAPLGFSFEFRENELSLFQADENERAQGYATYVAAGMKPSIAAQILGVDLPQGVEYAHLDPVEVETDPSETAVSTGGQANPILGYHIEQGVVTRNEARGAVGLPPVDESQDAKLRDLRARLEIMTVAKNAGVPAATAARLVGLEVELPAPQPMPAPAATAQEDAADDDDERRAEVRRFRTWAKRRKAPNPAQFESALLSDADKRAILAEAATAQPPFGMTTPNRKAMLLQLDPDDDEAEAAIRLPVEDRAARGLHRAFQDMLETLYPEGYGEWADPEIEAGRVHALFLEDQALRNALHQALLESADLGVSVAVSQFEGVGLGFDWTLANIAARDWAAQHTGVLITQIADTTRDGVRQAVARWIESGEPLDALVSDLGVFFSAERARLIASTEVTAAYAEAAAIAYRESGVVQEVEWRTAADERVCIQCGPLHGQRRSLLSPDFGNGLAGPPAHPRCRCWIAPVIGS